MRHFKLSIIACAAVMIGQACATEVPLNLEFMTPKTQQEYQEKTLTFLSTELIYDHFVKNYFKALRLKDFFKTDTMITKVDLTGIDIGILYGALGALKDHKGVKTLMLNHVFTGCASSSGAYYWYDSVPIAKQLAGLIRDNKVLTEIEMTYNFIEDKGAEEIAKSLKINNTLTKLDLSGNFMTDVGIVCLYESLESNDTLQVLNVEAQVTETSKDLISKLNERLDYNKEIAAVKKKKRLLTLKDHKN